MNNSKTDSNSLGLCPSVSRNPSRVSTIATTVMTTIACPLTVLLNALVVIAVMKKKQLRSIPTILLASLATADLLIGAIAEPLFITAGIFRLLNDFKTMCTLSMAGLFVLHLTWTSIYHLTAMAWERYVAIKNAIKYKVIVTRSRVKMCAIASWVFTAISTAPSVLFSVGVVDREVKVILNMCFFTAPLTICMVTIPVVYSLIYLEIRRRKQTAVIQLLSPSAQNAAAIERKVVKTTLLLTVALLISFAPLFVLLFFTHIFDFASKDVFQWVVALNQLHSLANPILYFYRNRRFRNTVLEMLNMRKPPANQISPNKLPQEPNAMQPNHTPAKPSTWQTNALKEKHEVSNATRPTAAPVYSNKEEINPLNQTSGFSWVLRKGDSRIRAATIGAIEMQMDLATSSQTEQEESQRKSHSYAKKTGSLPVSRTRVFKNTVLDIFKIRKPPENQIPPDELSEQDTNNSTQSNHTGATPHAWEPHEADHEASKATRPKTAPVQRDIEASLQSCMKMSRSLSVKVPYNKLN